MENIGFTNYRSYINETIISIKPITLLTGPNNSGKSSVLKAAKLLKQNSNGHLPFNLNFLPDDYGHFLGNFESIKNYNSKSDEISFSYKLDLPALGSECYSKLTYRKSKNDNTSACLCHYTLLTHVNGKTREILKLFPKNLTQNKDTTNNSFYEMDVNFELVRDLFETTFLPILNNENGIYGDIFNEDYIHVKNLPRFKYNPNNRIYGFSKFNHLDIAVQDRSWVQYDSRKPILPFYKILTGEFPYSKIDKSTETTINEIKQIYSKQGILFKKGLTNKSFYNYFQSLEKKLFKSLKVKEAKLPFELDLEFDNSPNIQWGGLIYDNTLDDEDFKTSEYTKSILRNFDPLFFELMKIYNSYFDVDLIFSDSHLKSNTGIVNEFIIQSILDSISQTSKAINSPYFFDSNRIEQTLFYHSIHSRIGYNLLLETIKTKSEYNFQQIRKSLRLMEIAEDFEIIPEKYGILSVYLINQNGKRNLSEFGYGATKIFFLILALNNYGNIYIEEPESNLHPNLQSKLADLFSYEQKSKDLIIETHSEYLIRRLQYLAAIGKIKHDNIIINYFNSVHDKKNSGNIKKIEIREDGALTDEFGPGFFNESTNLMRDLFKITSLS